MSWAWRSPSKGAKGKAPSTAADVLEALAPQHEIVAKVLDYRQLAKLKGTYVDALPGLIHPDTGRLHTTFNQTGAATGRLSSSNPNLQNIPIRTELGRRDPRRVRAARGLETGGGRLFANRVAPARALLSRPRAAGGLPQRRGHPHPHGGRGFWRAAADGHAGTAPQRQDRQLRHRLRTDALRTGGPAWDRPVRSRAVHKRLFRALLGGQEVD